MTTFPYKRKPKFSLNSASCPPNVSIRNPLLARDAFVNQRFTVGQERGDLGSDVGDNGYQLSKFRVEMESNLSLFFDWWTWNQHPAITRRI